MDEPDEITEQTATERTVTKLTPDEKARFKRACRQVERSELRQLRFLVRKFNDETLGEEPTAVAA